MPFYGRRESVVRVSNKLWWHYHLVHIACYFFKKFFRFTTMATWHWEGLVVATPLVHSEGAILWLLPTGLMLIQGQVLAESTMDQHLTVIFWRGQSLKSNPLRGGISIQQGSLLLHGITWATTTDTTTWSVSASMSLSFVVSWMKFYQLKILNFCLQRNSYQAVVATDGRSTYVLFIYKDIRWTTGDASRGRRGFGGYVARAGINSGVGRLTYIPGSGSQSLMLRLETRTNVRMPGIFILRGSPCMHI